MLKSNRERLNALRFNYTFGVKGIDGNHELKSFMIKNLDRRMPRKRAAHQEMSIIGEQSRLKQEESIVREQMECAAYE